MYKTDSHKNGERTEESYLNKVEIFEQTLRKWNEENDAIFCKIRWITKRLCWPLNNEGL